MGIVSDFNYDVFISCAHANNQPIRDDDRGGVNELHDVLWKILRQEMRAQPEISRDAGGLDGESAHGGIRTVLNLVLSFLQLSPGLTWNLSIASTRSSGHFSNTNTLPSLSRCGNKRLIVAYDAGEDTPRSSWARPMGRCSGAVQRPVFRVPRQR